MRSLDHERGIAMWMRTTTLALAATLLASTTASAWGPHGHEIISKMAESRLTPEAKAAIRSLLNEGDTLVSVCNWADHEGHDAVPGSASWHYVNVPLDAERYEAKFCPEKGCVVSKIKHYRKVLADRKPAAQASARRALLFLVHFVEDVHQPLHVGENQDRGGTLTQVRFLDQQRGTNLHHVWDSSLIDHLGRDRHAWVEKVEALATPENVEEWSRGSVEDWATESLEAAKVAYHDPKGGDRPLASGTELGEDYVATAAPIVRKRLAQAGVRLAIELNAIFK